MSVGSTLEETVAKALLFGLGREISFSSGDTSLSIDLRRWQRSEAVLQLQIPLYDIYITEDLGAASREALLAAASALLVSWHRRLRVSWQLILVGLRDRLPGARSLIDEHCYQHGIVLPSARKKLNFPITESAPASNPRLPINEVEPRIEIIDTTLQLAPILAGGVDLMEISADIFEILILDRLRAMGLQAERVGSTYARDGGVDICFSSAASAPFPFLGAVQAKHHRQMMQKTGVATIRDFSGTVGGLPFDFGLVVTNTGFTADARWFADRLGSSLRLRDNVDLKRWLLGEFSGEPEWREIPRQIEITRGLVVPIPGRGGHT